MRKAIDLPNIGDLLAQKLRDVGIEDEESLIEIGSKEAFLKLVEKEVIPCINVLYALEGAVQGIRWHQLTKEDKKALRQFFDQITKK